MAKLGFDIDHVLYRFYDVLRNHIHRVSGKPLAEMPDPTVWNFMVDQWGLTMPQYINYVIDGIVNGEIFWKGEPYPLAKYVIEKLKYEYGHEIVLVTARSFPSIENVCRYATEHWLNDEIGIPYDELIIVGPTDSKVGHNIDVLFDDAPHHLIEWNDNGDNVVAFDQVWNAHLHTIPRVVGWLGILEYVQKNFGQQSKTMLTEQI